MREKYLIHSKECFLVVDEQLEHVRLVLASEVANFNAALSQFGQLQQTSLEVLRFLRGLVNLVELLAVQDFGLKSPLHNGLPGFLDALNEEILHVSLGTDLTNPLEARFLVDPLLALHRCLHVSDSRIVVCFQ